MIISGGDGIPQCRMRVIFIACRGEEERNEKYVGSDAMLHEELESISLYNDKLKCGSENLYNHVASTVPPKVCITIK